MSSPSTPFIDLETESSTPDSTDYFVSGESPIKAGHQANEHLAAPTIPASLQRTFIEALAAQEIQRIQNANYFPIQPIGQGNASPATPLVQIDPGSSSPTEVNDDASASLQNEPSAQIAEHLNSAFATSTPGRSLLTPTTFEAQQSLDAIAFNPILSRRTTSRTGSTPRCLSPTMSSRRSMNSSDRDRSMESYSSSEYLTPPLFQSDCDNPPFIPLLGDRNSLTMMGSRRGKTNLVGDGFELKQERKRRRRSRYKKKRLSKHEEQSFRPRSECQVDPTAPHGMQNLCSGCTDRHVSQGNTHCLERCHKLTSSTPFFPGIVRRWSSVEIGAHQVPSASSVLFRNAQYPSITNTPSNAFLSTDIEQRVRSSSFPPAGMEQDILETVRQRLSFRELERLLPNPSSITVSRPRLITPTESLPSLQTFNPQELLGNFTSGQSVAQHQRASSLTYLITAKDIESITDLIATNIEARYSNQERPMMSRSKTTMSDLPITGKGKGIDKTIATESEYLQVSDNRGKKLSTSRRDSFKSTEMIWQNSPSPRDDDSFSEDASPKSESSHGSLKGQASDLAPKISKQQEGPAFDPQNARTSINKWQNDISLVVTSDDDKHTGASFCTVDDGPEPSTVTSESHNKERQKPRPFLRYSSSSSAMQDVESFPPLPERKMTSDWHSPLPEMEVMTPRAPCSEVSPSRQITPKASQISWARSAQMSPTKETPGMSMDIDWKVDAAFKSPELLSPDSLRDASPFAESHRRNTVKLHPSATSRTGSAASMGSSLGTSTHERIRNTRPSPPTHTKIAIYPPEASSSAGLQVPSLERTTSTACPIRRVRTIDNVHKGEHKPECSKWRAPSICPLPQESSPSEEDDEDVSPQGYFDMSLASGTMPISSPSHLERIQRVFHRMSAERDTCPPSVKVDQVGIYGQMTRAWSDLSVSRRVGERLSGSGEGHKCDNVAKYPESDRNPGVD